MEEHWVLIPKDQVQCKEAMIPTDARFFLSATVAGDKITLEVHVCDADEEIIFETGLSECYQVFPVKIEITLPCDLKRLAMEFADQMDLIYGRKLVDNAHIMVCDGVCQLMIGEKYHSWAWINGADDGGEEAEDEVGEDYENKDTGPPYIDSFLEERAWEEAELLARQI